jgi:hypothetical protein
VPTVLAQVGSNRPEGGPMNDRLRKARMLAWIASDLDRRGLVYAGFVRQCARSWLEVPEHRDHGCRGCGAELTQPATGRRRVWCGEACRSRTRRR